MKHSEVHSYMPDYLEGSLDLTKRALLDAHLDACERCSRDFAEMRGTIALLRDLPDPEPPAFLAETVMRRIREGEGRYGLGDRVREWIASVASPQIALPAIALTVGLMMATGILDSGALPGFEHEASPSRGIQIVMRTGEPLAAPNDALVSGRAPYLTVGNAPPAVGRVPRISITLPTPGTPGASRLLANGAANAPHVVTRWPRSIRSAGGILGDGQSRSMSVGNRVSLDGAGLERATLQGSAFAPQTLAASDASPEARRAAELDPRIERMIGSPIAFAGEFSGLSLAEREIWLKALAERVSETGRGDEALRALRLTGDARALELATALSPKLRRVAER